MLVGLVLPAGTRAQFVSLSLTFSFSLSLCLFFGCNLHISCSLILSAPRYQETNYKCPGSWNELWKLYVGNCEVGPTSSSGVPYKRGTETWKEPDARSTRGMDMREFGRINSDTSRDRCNLQADTASRSHTCKITLLRVLSGDYSSMSRQTWQSSLKKTVQE